MAGALETKETTTTKKRRVEAKAKADLIGILMRKRMVEDGTGQRKKKQLLGLGNRVGSGFPLQLGACREEPGGADGVPIGEPEAADTF